MKKVALLLFVLTLLFIVGCAQQEIQPQKIVVEEQPTELQTTQEVVQDVSVEIVDIDDLESELDFSDLDLLDEDLNFDI